jgi:hypothetical protein
VHSPARSRDDGDDCGRNACAIRDACADNLAIVPQGCLVRDTIIESPMSRGYDKTGATMTRQWKRVGP